MTEPTATTLANDPQALVSVILPIYNAGPYLDQALDSVQNQTHQNVEIICVNDGSTDNSLEIINAHAAKDPRIVVINKENGGYGSAMNRGLSEASGEWIAILEPDDWIEVGMFKDLLEFGATFTEHLDMIKSPYWRITNPDTPQQQKLACAYKVWLHPKRNQQPCTIQDLSVLLAGNHPSIWSAIYRKDFLDSNNIRFPEIPGAGWADNPFFMETLCKAKAVAYVNTPYYCYREETREKAVNFHKKNPSIPFERWQDTMDIMEQTNTTQDHLLAAHYVRGFKYMGGVLEQYPLGSNPQVDKMCTDMMNRMKPEIIAGMSDLSPALVDMYCRLTGNPPIKSNQAKYVASLAKKAAAYTALVGPVNTLTYTFHFLQRVAVRSGK